MKTTCRAPMNALLLPALLLCHLFLVVPAAMAQQQVAPPAPAANTGPGQAPVDPRVQVRTYHFDDTNEDLPYAVFVSSKVSPDKENPLVIALHGLGGSHLSLLRNNALDLAEEGGYILVGPMGYNPRGWYGIPDGPRLENAYPTTRVTPPPQNNRPATAQTPPNDPANLRELSEKDVLNVLALVREEFNVDDNRIYLMGHSMGGAGTFHLAVKYPQTWAAVAAIAPAAFRVDPNSIARIPDMPVFIIHGVLDTAVPVEVSQTWVKVMQQNNMTHEYQEIPDGDHGNVIPTGMPGIFAFFGQHTKPVSP